MLKSYAVGDSIEARFRAVITPEALSAGCWMTTNEDEKFRAAVGAVMVSYGGDSPEFDRIRREMEQINRFSAWIQAAQVGLTIEPPVADDDALQPIGLLGLWNSRERQ